MIMITTYVYVNLLFIHERPRFQTCFVVFNILKFFGEFKFKQKKFFVGQVVRRARMVQLEVCTSDINFVYDYCL